MHKIRIYKVKLHLRNVVDLYLLEVLLDLPFKDVFLTFYFYLKMLICELFIDLVLELFISFSFDEEFIPICYSETIVNYLHLF